MRFMGIACVALATLLLGANAAGAGEGLTLRDLLDGASFTTPSGLEFSEFQLDEFDVELARDIDVIVLYNGFQFFFAYEDVDPGADAGFDLRYLVRPLEDPASPGREPRMGSVVLSVQNTDEESSGKSFFESGSIVFEDVESGIEESSLQLDGTLFGSFLHVDHGVRHGGAKKATRKKATRRKATRKKARRKKATRKKATSETTALTESSGAVELPVLFSEVDDIVFLGGSGQVTVTETHQQVGEEEPQ